MAEWLWVADKNIAGTQWVYVNVANIETVREEGADTFLTLTSGREVRAASNLDTLRPALGLSRR